MKSILIKFLYIFLFSSFSQFVLGNESLNISSPDGKINVHIDLAESVYYSVFFENQRLTLPSPLSVTLLNGEVLGEKPIVEKIDNKQVRATIYSVVGNASELSDDYNEVTVRFKGDFSIIFRAYDEGIAYRFFINKKNGSIIKDEQVMYRFAGNPSGYFPISESRERSLFNWQENYRYNKISEIKREELSYLPIVVELENNLKIAITEADLRDYPGLYLEKSLITVPSAGQSALQGYFAKNVETTKWGGWKDACLMPDKRFNYIAETKSEKFLPWRVMIIADDDKKLGYNELVYKLATPNKLKNTDWIKPGKVAWDWYNNFKVINVDFVSGPNTPTWKYYIDFASENNIEYVVLDEGWSYVYDMKMLSPDVNLKELSDYAKSKNIGLVLWAAAHILSQDLDGNLDYMKQFDAVKGIKIDFFQRNDQHSIKMYEDIAKAAAEREFFVDYHGCYIPTGLRRTYPNILTWEAVKGLESNKWSNTVTPEHDVILAFTRLLAGPMDYTPGAMDNAAQSRHLISGIDPKSQGTLCHQLSMYVIYDSPLQMLADNPDSYRSAGKQVLNYLSSVPTVWDETIVLDGKMAKYIIKARKSGNEWYIGGMTNWDAREVEIKFDFLGEGDYIAECLVDGVNAAKYGSDFKYTELKVDKNSKETFKMYPGGGLALRLIPK